MKIPLLKKILAFKDWFWTILQQWYKPEYEHTDNVWSEHLHIVHGKQCQWQHRTPHDTPVSLSGLVSGDIAYQHSGDTLVQKSILGVQPQHQGLVHRPQDQHRQEQHSIYTFLKIAEILPTDSGDERELKWTVNILHETVEFILILFPKLADTLNTRVTFYDLQSWALFR